MDNDFQADIEVVLTTLSNSRQNDDSTSSVYGARIVNLINHNLISYTQTQMNWSAIDETDENGLRYKERNVIDMVEGFVYSTNLETSQCRLKQVSHLSDKKR